MRKAEHEVLLDPTLSNLDYISHKVSQAHLNPWHILTDLNRLKRRVPGTKAIPIDPPMELHHPISKVALITLTLNNPRFAVFASEKIHPGLVVKELSFESPDRALFNPRAFARVRRTSHRTYVNIIDLDELDARFFSDVMGSYQSETNWSAWRRAITENDGCLLIASIPSSLDLKQMKFVSKIKVTFAEE